MISSLKKLWLVSVLCLNLQECLPKPPGLPNVGNTCYMNASLQNFYNMSLLTNEILAKEITGEQAIVEPWDEDEAIKKSSDFLQGYIDVIAGMYNLGGDTAVLPLHILKNLEALGCLRISIGAGFQQDPDELTINPILRLLPNELRKVFNLDLQQSMVCPLKKDRTKYESPTGRMSPASNYYISVPIKGDSLLDSLSEGYFLGESLKGFNTYRFDEVNRYDEIKKKFVVPDKEMFYQSMIQVYEEALTQTKSNEDRKKIKKMLEDHKKSIPSGIYIQGCRPKLVMNNFPEYLIIQLKRFDNKRKKINKAVKVPFDLDITQYGENNLDPNQGKYSLIGSINHAGATIQSGHYTAYIKDQYDVAQPWYDCNDSHVTLIKETDLKNLDTEGYFLFYIRSDVIPNVKSRAAEIQANRMVIRLAESLVSL